MAHNDDDARFLDSLLDAVSRPHPTTGFDDDDNIEDLFNPQKGTSRGGYGVSTTSATAGGRHSRFPASNPVTSAAAADFRSLTRFFVAEKAVSTLLPWPAALVGRVMNRLERQVSKIEAMQAELEAQLAADADDADDDDDNNGDGGRNRQRRGRGKGGNDSDFWSSTSAAHARRFMLVAIETDLERYKFLIRALLRTRLAKVSEFGRTWLRHDEQLVASAAGGGDDADLTASSSTIPGTTTTATPRMPPRPGRRGTTGLPLLLGPEEKSFAVAHTTLWEQHVQASFLDRFPTSLQRLDDNAAGLDMLQGPDEHECVIIRVLEGAKDGDKTGGKRGGLDDDGDDDMMGLGPGPGNWNQGDIWIVPWSQAKREWERGRIELL